jgi:hypothetical protein
MWLLDLYGPLTGLPPRKLPLSVAENFGAYSA